MDAEPPLAVVDLHCSVGTAPGFDFADPEPLLAQMDRCGVSRAVLGAFGRWAAVDHEAGDRILQSWCERWPGRFSRWASVNPWWSDAEDRVSRLLADGAVGIQLIPAVQGFSLLQLPLVEPLLTVAEATGTPVYVVTGVPVAAEPLQLAELARRFPDVTFVLGRTGRTDFLIDALSAMQAVPNVVAETAYNPTGLIQSFVQTLGAGRVAFASDAPFNDLDLEIGRVTAAGLDSASLAQVLAGTTDRLLGAAAR